MFMNLLYIAVPVVYRLVGWRNVAENAGLNFSLKFRIMKKTKVSLPRLSLQKETVVSLNHKESSFVVGGSDRFGYCQPPTFTVDGTIVYTKMHHTCYACTNTGTPQK